MDAQELCELAAVRNDAVEKCIRRIVEHPDDPHTIEKCNVEMVYDLGRRGAAGGLRSLMDMAEGRAPNPAMDVFIMTYRSWKPADASEVVLAALVEVLGLPFAVPLRSASERGLVMRMIALAVLQDTRLHSREH